MLRPQEASGKAAGAICLMVLMLGACSDRSQSSPAAVLSDRIKLLERLAAAGRSVWVVWRAVDEQFRALRLGQVDFAAL